MNIKTRIIDYYTTPAGKQPARDWLMGTKDHLTQAIIFKRIRQAGLGQFGKVRSVGEGVQELKIDYGPGFRVYFGIHHDEVILILAGGNKTTQQTDIKKAKTYWLLWKKEKK